MSFFRLGITLVLFGFPNPFPSSSENIPGIPPQQIVLVAPLNLPGSFVSSQAVYADTERIYACSFQGDLFILERDRQFQFPLIQTISVGSPLFAVRGDKDNLYVSGRNGNLYIFSKTWPVRLSNSVSLSNYGLSALQVAADNVYVAKGQAAMTASDNRLYLSELNPGDSAVDVSGQRTFGQAFVAGTTTVFDRETLQPVGSLPNPRQGQVSLNTWGGFVYLTNPGCCSSGVYIFDAQTLQPFQLLNRAANTVAGTQRKGIPLVVTGSEAGDVDLYALGRSGYQLIHSINLRTTTGFTGSEDIEIRTLWVDGIDNLVFAGSSWGNDQSRSQALPSLFVLEIRTSPVIARHPL